MDDEKHEMFKAKRKDLSQGTHNVGIPGIIFFLPELENYITHNDHGENWKSISEFLCVFTIFQYYYV